MGFNADGLRFLLSAYKLGLQGSAALTLGRLTLLMKPAHVERMLRDSGIYGTLPRHRPVYYADDVFRSAGFSIIDSMDASNYEGASIIHDLNRPVPESLHGRYDLVWDGGTLEHVFHFTNALENAMRMVKVGGHLVLYTPANNQCGHGFYQFSPELYFRAFSEENGFDLVRMYATGKGGPYHVADPMSVHGRVELFSGDATFLMVHARKTRETPLFEKAPQQSDYVSTWTAPATPDGRLKAFLRRALPPQGIAAISRFLNERRRRSAVRRWLKSSRLSNRKLYVPVTRWDITSRDAMK